MEDRELTNTLSAYVQARDSYATNYRNRNSSPFGPKIVGGPLQFSQLLNENARILAGMLPQMNLTEWEALSELCSTYLALLRMRNVKK